MAGQVTNALSTEEKPIIENIISLFQQLLSLQGEASAAGEVAPEPSAEEVAAMAEEEDEMDPAQAVDVEKSSDGETGDSDAEERLEEVTPTTDLSLQELGKTLASLQKLVGNKTRTVKKSGLNQNSELLKEVKKINNTIQTVMKTQQQQEQFNQHLMDALGFSEEVVKKSLPSKQPDENKPIQNIDQTAVLKNLLAEVFKAVPAMSQNQEYRHPFNQKREARKDLKDIAQYIHQRTTPNR